LSFARVNVFLVFAVVLFAADDPDILLRQAQADLNAGRYSEAIESSDQAAKLLEKTGDPGRTARAITISGLAQMYLGSYEPALRRFHQANVLAQQANDFDRQVTSLNNIGTALYFEGRYSEAMERYREGMDLVASIADEKARASRRQLTVANTAILYQTLGQYDRALTLFNDLLNAPQALPPLEQAQLLANIGVLRRRLGDPQKALLTYQSAQALYRKTGSLGGEIAVLNNIGIVQAMDLVQLPAAAASFTNSLRLAEQSGDRPLAIQAHLYRGETYLRAGDWQESAADFEAASTGAKLLGEHEEEWKAQYGLASVAVRRGDRAGGTKILHHAVELIEHMRGALSNASLRSSFLADKRSVYDLLIENTDDTAEVFKAMEQSRARNLRDRVSSGDPISLDSLSHRLSSDTAVLEYWMGDSSAAVLWISSRETKLTRWALTGGDRDAANSARLLLANPKGDYSAATGALATHLLAGIVPLNDSQIRRLIIVPDGPLGQIPFEALPFSGGLLIDRFTVSYSPSAALITTSPKRRTIRWFWQPSIEAFANPPPGTGASNDLVNSPNWMNLADAGREIHGISRALGGRAVLVEGSAARRSAVMHNSHAPVLHFATHAFADVENPDLSYIVLAPSAPGQRFDYLFQKEVAQLPLDGVQLLTLSACETAVGKIVPGEGVQSFSGAFLAAGVPSVITSLWSVNDQATADFMIRVYARLAAGESVEESLRLVKLEFLHSTAVTHPAYWAAFVVNGDGTARLPYIVGWQWVAGSLLVVGGAMFFLLKHR
jgi:CHAT domain-containing protein